MTIQETYDKVKESKNERTNIFKTHNDTKSWQNPKYETKAYTLLLELNYKLYVRWANHFCELNLSLGDYDH